MRERHHVGPLAVQAIGGTAVVMLDFGMKEVTPDVNKHVLSSTPSSCWSIRSATIRP